jgi:hypothetical protein
MMTTHTTDRLRAATARLADYLDRRGPVLSAEVKAAARAAGISLRTLHRAAEQLDVRVAYTSYTEWSLPS